MTTAGKIILSIVIVVAIAAGASYYGLTHRPIKTISIVPTPTSETASWKTYSTKEGGYSIKYPSTWTYDVSLEPSEIFLHPLTPNGDQIQIDYSSEGRSLQELIKETRWSATTYQHVPWYKWSYSKFQIAGANGYVTDNTSALALINGMSYRFGYQPDLAVAQKILGSIQFFAPTEPQ